MGFCSPLYSFSLALSFLHAGGVANLCPGDSQLAVIRYCVSFWVASPSLNEIRALHVLEKKYVMNVQCNSICVGWLHACSISALVGLHEDEVNILF